MRSNLQGHQIKKITRHTFEFMPGYFYEENQLQVFANGIQLARAA